MERTDKVRMFLDLHRPGSPLLLPNPWDVGSARLIASLGFEALATTSSGFAGTLGRLDGNVTSDEALRHAGAIASATSLPVSADLENGFGHQPEAVAETVRQAAAAGLAGCSIEDYSGDETGPIYDATLAAERVAAVDAPVNVLPRSDGRAALRRGRRTHPCRRGPLPGHTRRGAAGGSGICAGRGGRADGPGGVGEGVPGGVPDLNPARGLQYVYREAHLCQERRTQPTGYRRGALPRFRKQRDLRLGLLW